MSKFIASWLAAAAEALGAEWSRPVDLLPGAVIAAGAATVTLTVDLAGNWEGSLSVTAEEAALSALFAEAEGAPAKTAESVGGGGGPRVLDRWQALFRRVCIAAAADLGRQSGRGCEVAMISPDGSAVGSDGMGYQLRFGEQMVPLLIADRVEEARPAATAPSSAASAGVTSTAPEKPDTAAPAAAASAVAARGVELLLDVELEASLRFGSRELTLGELLALGPGDVVQLDRALADPVDLILGDKIVARGEVVLVNGNFGLQVTEVAEPRKSLESIRCLF
jgi:flagellar motor switch protein FliN/FliY